MINLAVCVCIDVCAREDHCVCCVVRVKTMNLYNRLKQETVEINLI